MFDESSTKLCQANGEIFFRDSDITRFQRVFDAVVDDSQHLLVTSHFDGVIDHYGKMMLNRLKMRSGMAVETYMPASTEALVNRFNELINSMSVEEARGERASQTPGRIIVVNDPKAVDSDGWALLSRMVTDFPGLNMRLVFLLDRIPTNVEKALDRFGSRLIRWEVEPPTPDEQLALRKEGMAESLEFQVERVLSRINQTLSQQLEPSLSADERDTSLQLDLDETLGGATEAGEREADDMRALFEEEETKRRSSSVALVVLLLLLGSGATVVAGFVSPALGQQLDRLLMLVGIEDRVFSRESETQSVVEAAYNSAVQDTPKAIPKKLTELPKLPELAEAPVENSQLKDLQASSPEQIARTQLANEVAESSVGQLEEQDVVSPASDPIVEPQEPPVAEVIVNEQVTAVSTPEPEPEPEPQAESEPVSQSTPDPEPVVIPDDPAVQRVKGADPRQQFVQHIVLVSRARADAWIATQTGLSQAIVVPINVEGKRQFAVVSGPFENREDTRTYIQGLSQGADYWVRTAGSLQRILQDGE